MNDYIAFEHEPGPLKHYTTINWCLTNLCNYSCSYCPPSLHNGTARGIDFPTIKIFLDKVFKHFNNKPIFFELTGGEVTYYKEFEKLITYIKDNGHAVGLLSNGGRKMKWWQDNKEKIDHICLSYHSEQGKPDHFFEVVKLMNDHATVHVNIMMLGSNFEESYELGAKIADKIMGVSVSLQPLLENMDGEIYDYTTEQKEILDNQTITYNENPEFKEPEGKTRKDYRGRMIYRREDQSLELTSTTKLVLQKLNSWTGWKCYAGIENLVIDYVGNIRRGWCGEGGVIGNIRDEELSLPIEPIICAKQYCNCGLDIMCTKERIL